jgi:hypothetical protein
MQQADRPSHSRDTVNRRGLLLALIPLLLSVLALAGWLYINNDSNAERTWKVGADRTITNCCRRLRTGSRAKATASALPYFRPRAQAKA